MKRKANENGITAIYVRRSVADRDNNSLSIESQKEDCIRYAGKNSVYRIYCDNGFSGKDTEHRPAFMTMMQDARDGLISRIIVKKYDRFSRNLRDYLNVSEELDKLGVSVYSLSEPFNTETKEGRLMRNNLLSFAEFERETIAGRVADAYSTRGRETGFYQGGVMCFGYSPERMTVNGKNGSVLVPSEQAEALIKAYEMYSEQSVSLRDVLDYLNSGAVVVKRTDRFGGKDGKHNGKLNIGSLSTVLANPIYVRADKDVYAFFQSKGYEIIDDIDAYDGIHGVFLHKRNDGRKYAKIAYHEGLISSELWLRVQDKKARNVCFSSNRKAYNSWLIGLIKCKECGYGVMIDIQVKKKSGKRYRYMIDNGWATGRLCVKRSYQTIKIDEVEESVFQAMKERMKQFEIARKQKNASDYETESIKADILRIDDEINSLMNRMAQADDVVFSYIQQKIKELHSKKSEMERKLQTRARKIKSIDIKPLSEPLSHWEELSVQEKHDIAVEMIDVIYISHFSSEIEIKFGI